MTIQDFGSIGELVGAIATIATLVYLANQIRHNTTITRTSSLQSMLDGGRDRTIQPIINNPEVADIFARGMTSFDRLSSVERVRFTWIICETVLQMQNVMQLHDEKILADVDYEAWLAWTAAVLRTPGGAVAWPQVSGIVTPTIRDVLIAHLKATPDQPSVLDLMPVIDARTWDDGAV